MSAFAIHHVFVLVVMATVTDMDTLTKVAFVLTIPGQPVSGMDTLTRVAFILMIHGQPWMITS